ncbi:MAG: hypothetical protein WBC60_06470 [Cognaticolwellia sp.]|jgi:hypothetical protein
MKTLKAPQLNNQDITNITKRATIAARRVKSATTHAEYPPTWQMIRQIS